MKKFETFNQEKTLTFFLIKFLMNLNLPNEDSVLYIKCEHSVLYVASIKNSNFKIQ